MNLFELFVKIGVDDQASGKLSSLSSKFGTGLQTAAKVGVAAVTAVGSGIAALGTYAAKVGGDFEAQMSKVSAISGATGNDLQALEDKAKQLGIDTKFSATEAGQAFEYMAMAGWKTEQMLDGVAGIMDLAAASGEDLAMVSDIVTDAMTAFGLSADQSTHFADVLAKASSNANTNVGLMGETFKYVAPVAGAMGFSIEDTATAIGLMANAGIKGSQAGTALRSMMSRLSSATAKNAEYFAQLDKEIYSVNEDLSFSEKVSASTGDGFTELDAALGFLGITTSDINGKMRPLQDVMLDLRKAMSGLTQEEQAFAAKAIAGQEAMPGLLAIVNASDEDFEKLSESIYDADGASKQMADTMANNLQGRLTLLKSSAEGFGLALYDKIQKPLTEMASWAVDSLNQLTTAFNENGVDGLVEAAGNILSEAINEIVNGLPQIVDLAIRVIDSFIGGINDNLDTIVNGAISVVMTLADGILNMLPDIVKLGLDLIVSLANGIAENLGTLIPTIIDVVLQIVNTLTDQESLTALLGAVLTIIKELAWGITNNIDKIIDAVFTLLDSIIDFLLRPENLAMLIETAIQLVLAIGVGIIKAIPQLLVSVASLIGSIFTNFLTADWGSIGKNIVEGLKSGISNAWNNLVDWFENLFDDLIGIAEKILGIASPSKVFKKIGVFTAKGFGVGFRDAFGDVERDIERMLDFNGTIFGVNAYGTYSGGGAFGGISGTSFGTVNINIEGYNAQDDDELAEMIAEKLQIMTERKGAVFA